MDLAPDQIEVFRRNARELGVSEEIKQSGWKEMIGVYDEGEYDFVFCRGNSFIYAAGGWNERQKVDRNKSLKDYKETLKIFYKILRRGGILYIDKFKDGEVNHREVIGKINGLEEEVIYYIQRFPVEKRREAALFLRDERGIERGLINVTYDLSDSELEETMRKVGFEVERMELESEKNFNVWLGRK